MTEYDDGLHYIETIRYGSHTIKIARRGNQIKVLIYSPGELLATRLVEDDLTNYEAALEKARRLIDG